MREFGAHGGGRLTRMSAGAKGLYLSFNLLTLLGFATSLALYWDSLGLLPSGAADHYLGNADDPNAVDLLVEKSPRELLEVTHFHLFTVPVCMLVLGHLFLLARGGPWKTWVVAAAPVLTFLHVAGPWIVKYGGRDFGWVMGATGGPFVLVYLVMALWPIPELLSRSEPRPETRSST